MIEIACKHSLPRSEARRAAHLVIREMEARLGFSGLVSEWKGDTLHLNAPTGPAQGMTGEFAVSVDTVRVTLDVTPTLGLMRKTIETGLAQFLRRSFQV